MPTAAEVTNPNLGDRQFCLKIPTLLMTPKNGLPKKLVRINQKSRKTSRIPQKSPKSAKISMKLHTSIQIFIWETRRFGRYPGLVRRSVYGFSRLPLKLDKVQVSAGQYSCIIITSSGIVAYFAG